ncbi:SpaH/EbpB family LPXTG-anchored major pilin [Knoellia koreensis]|uniref:SpaH/EbpB family LPXTG-anchored major pilin n=1 Tax=Knoellia koreensis TaxID=2730921 RepID=A0A849HBZ3_9MICO|nr:SpaH/EbpB family LPXTG-anchored major pilin [Knoellia sp. DB2414S]NNM47256.1 SpaH/EbpB family LPXTG-anchored major pilin [Knoellia sp. DB2414S]
MALRWAGMLLLALACELSLAVPATAAPLAAAAPAVAAPTAAPSAFTPVDPTEIPADATGRLVIHKHLQAGLDQTAYPADGTALTLPDEARAIAGAVFTVTRVDGVDVRTTDGWKQVQAYQEDLTAARANLGATVKAAPTGSDGVTVVGDLPVGLYLVHEVGVMGPGGSPDPSYLGAADFLVTIPMVAPSGTSWSYDVNVYPKNSKLGVTKTVADGNAGVAGQDAPVAGHVLTYTIDADIPRGVALPAFAVRDDLATAVVPGSNPVRHTSDYLELSGAGWTGAVTLAVVGAATSPLVACAEGTTTGCDYVLERTSSSVAAAFTASGLTRLTTLSAFDPGAVVRLTLQARVKASVTETTTMASRELARGGAAPVLTLPNTAVACTTGMPVGAASGGAAPLASVASCGVASNTVRTVFSTMRIHKVAASTGADLAGARFTAYRTEADARAGRNPVAVSAPTDADGMTQLPGLHVNDLQNDGPATDSYWLLETTAPTGYVASGEPIRVRVLQDGRTEKADATGGVRIVNDPSGSADPVTGGGTVEHPGSAGSTGSAGPLAFTGVELLQMLLLGCGLLVAGLVLAWFARHRRDETAEAV